MFSILIPTFNNIEYLKLCIESIEKNSQFKNQIILHINEGTDGTFDFIKDKYEFTFSENNIGMPKALNRASKLAKFDYLVISHDDFYFCPGWDNEFYNEIKNIKHNNFYLSGTMVGDGQIYFDAGRDFQTFDEKKLLNNLDKIKSNDFQGSTKCPGLIHKSIWSKVGGWSEEFSPTGGDDTDFAMKLWKSNVRIFKGLGKCLVYHFGSITTRKKNKKLFTYLGSRGNKIFLKKWGLTVNFFEKKYLRSGIDKNSNLIVNKYESPLNEPIKNLNYYKDLFKCKLFYLYLKLIRF